LAVALPGLASGQEVELGSFYHPDMVDPPPPKQLGEQIEQDAMDEAVRIANDEQRVLRVAKAEAKRAEAKKSAAKDANKGDPWDPKKKTKAPATKKAAAATKKAPAKKAPEKKASAKKAPAQKKKAKHGNPAEKAFKRSKKAAPKKKKAPAQKKEAPAKKDPAAVKKKAEKFAATANKQAKAMAKVYFGTVANPTGKPMKEEDLGESDTSSDAEQAGWGAPAVVVSHATSAQMPGHEEELGESQEVSSLSPFRRCTQSREGENVVCDTYGSSHKMCHSAKEHRAAACREAGELGDSAPATPAIQTDPAGLMNLIPVWKASRFGLPKQSHAEKNARRGRVYSDCVYSVKWTTFRDVCARRKCDYKRVGRHRKVILDSNGKPKCYCERYTMFKLPEAHRTIVKNAQRNFCKYSKGCDASLCYHPPYKFDWRTGKLRSPGYSTLRNKMISIKFRSGRVWGVVANIGVSLEKVAWCEKIRPPVMEKGIIKDKDCVTYKLCVAKKADIRRIYDFAGMPNPGYLRRNRVKALKKSKWLENMMKKAVNSLVGVICSKI